MKAPLRIQLFSYIWLIHAAAIILQSQIRSVHPTINGMLDEIVIILNKKLPPRVAIQIKKKRSSYFGHAVKI